MSRGKETGTIAALSLEVRTQINVKMRDGESLFDIALWLFDEMKLGARWLSADVQATNARDEALERCQGDLGRWLRGQYLRWIDGEANQNQTVRFVENVELCAAAAYRRKRKGSDAGAMLRVRSRLLDALEKVCQGSKDPAEVVTLADSFTRLMVGASKADAANRRVALLERETEQAGGGVKKSVLSREEQHKRLREIFGR